jgi:Flp pilus assembly pilin Flp
VIKSRLESTQGDESFSNASTNLDLRRENPMKKFVEVLKKDEGQDVVEYALLAAFISIVAIAVIKLIGPLVNTIYTNVKDALTP